MMSKVPVSDTLMVLLDYFACDFPITVCDDQRNLYLLHDLIMKFVNSESVRRRMSRQDFRIEMTSGLQASHIVMHPAACALNQ